MGGSWGDALNENHSMNKNAFIPHFPQLSGFCAKRRTDNRISKQKQAKVTEAQTLIM